LSIPYTDDISIIKKACNIKSFKVHPDRNKSANANEEFIDFLIVRDVLFTHKKINYDQRYFVYRKSNIKTDEIEKANSALQIDYQNICENQFEN
jgi:curved DNA-binding protein CbpA